MAALRVTTAEDLEAYGLCKRCIQRFIGKLSNYDFTEDSSSESSSDEDEHPVAKRMKLRMTDAACFACCGILEDYFIETHVLSNEQVKKALDYDSHTFVIHINIPLALVVRQVVVEMFLKDHLPRYFSDDLTPDVVPLNKAFSLSVQKALGKKIRKTFDRNSNFVIEFQLEYADDFLDLVQLTELQHEMTKQNKPIPQLSKSNVDEFIETVTRLEFLKRIDYPPLTKVRNRVTVQEVMCRHEPIFIAGRYCKFSRKMGQTPWFVNDVKLVDSSVQDVIFATLTSVFDPAKMIFSASGREDFDVRCLGDGRPFYVRIVDAKKTQICDETFRDIEHSIARSKMVKVRDLQFIDRKDLAIIKQGEESKQKTYKALVLIRDKRKLVPDYINKINQLKNLVIDQVTPVRVYHRRSGDSRKRTIHSIAAREYKGYQSILELVMVTQAGTYIKEFIHGDLGRTEPSLVSLIGCEVDILALDVTKIDLDFPQKLST